MKLCCSSIVLILLASCSWAQVAFKEPLHLGKNWFGQTPYSADFDNDGKMDLLHYSLNEVVVLYNNGSHDFTKTTIEIFPSTALFYDLTLAVGDLNADGKADFAFNTSSQAIPPVAFISTGRNFSRTEINNSGTNVLINKLQIADLDQDGKADIVGSGRDKVLYIFRGDGAGAFTLSRIENFPSMSYFVISDFNGDGKNDVAGVANDFTGTTPGVENMVVSLAGTNGDFTSKVIPTAGAPGGHTLATADFNGDHISDLVITVEDFTGPSFETNVYLNDGLANFTTSEALPVALTNVSALIDYNGDGYKDLAGHQINSVQITILRNNGAGLFTALDGFDGPQLYQELISAADFDRDGDEEIISGSFGHRVKVRDFSDGKLIDVETEVFGRNPRFAFSADMNRDGLQDLVVGNMFLSSIEILYGDPSQTYSINRTFDISGSECTDLVVADFNSDSYPDIVYAELPPNLSSTLMVILSTSNGDYAPPTRIGDSYGPLQTVDFNLDGKPDLISGNSRIASDGNGNFELTADLNLTGAILSINHDIDNDGFPDAVFAAESGIQIAFNNGHWEFIEIGEINNSFPVNYIEIGYVNSDQLPDIILGGQGYESDNLVPSKILINKGNRQFETTDQLIYYAYNASIADFNLDGRNDILTINSGKAYIQLQDEAGQFGSVVEIVDDSFYYDYVKADDLDNDGRMDFYAYKSHGGLHVVFGDVFVEPTIQASAIAIQSRSDTEVTATFHKGNGSGRLLLLRQNIESNEVPADNVFYNFSSSFPAGATIGEGNHVVLTGDVTSVYISELEEGVEYELVAFEYSANADKTMIDYNVTLPPSLRFTTKKNQTITFVDMTAVTFAPNPITVQVSASSGLAINLTVSSGQASINGLLATPLHPGPLTLKALQAGNDEYMPAPTKEVTFCVLPPVPTISINTNDPTHPVLTSSAATNNQWQKDGTDIPGATNQVLEPEEDGVYSVKVNYDGCSTSSLPTTVAFNNLVFEPTIQTSSLAIQGVSDDEVTATFHKGNGTGRLLLVRENVESDEVPVDGVFYDFSSSFPSGATIGEGNHVVLTGDETSVYISGLEEGVEYELVAFEYSANADKTMIDYNVTQAPSLRFTTKKKQTITFGDMSDVTFGPNPITVKVSASSGLAINLTVSSGQASIDGLLATPTHPGPLMLKASQPGNDEYMPATKKELTFCVFPPVPTISVNNDDPEHPVLTSSATTNNQWQENGTDIPGATGQTLEAEQNGIYSVKVNYSGCSRASLPTALVITGVLKEDSFRMFPNPVVSQLTIMVPAENGISALTMQDIHGRRVSPAVIIRGNAADVDVDGLAEGIYVVQVACGGSVYQQKILKVK